MADSSIPSFSGKTTSIYRCKYCGNTFVKADELINHKKKNHLAEIIAERKRKTTDLTNGDGRNSPTVNPPRPAAVSRLESASRPEPVNTSGFPPQPDRTVYSTPAALPELAKGSVIYPKPEPQPLPYTNKTTVDLAAADHNNDDDDENENTEKARDLAQVPDSQHSTKEAVPTVVSIRNVMTSQGSDTDRFVCPVCKINFNYDYQLIQHMSEKHESTGNGNEEMELEVEENNDESDAEETQPQQQETRLQILSLPHCFVVVTRMNIIDTEPSSSPSRKLKKPRRFKGILPRSLNHRSFKCIHCTRKFSSPGVLDIHIKIYHKGKPSPVPADSNTAPAGVTPVPVMARPGATSSSAGQTWNPRQHLSYHKSKKSKEKRHKCKSPGCNYATHELYTLRCHSRHHNDRQAFECHLCNASFSSSTGKFLHFRSSHPSDESVIQIIRENRLKRGIKPERDRESTRSNRTLSRSKKAQRSKERYRKNSIPDGLPHPCKDCSRVFPSVTTLNCHRRLKHGTQVKCDFCPYTSIKTNVQIHMKNLHENKYGDKHKCIYCGATCPANGVLRKHINMVHKKAASSWKNTGNPGNVGSADPIYSVENSKSTPSPPMPKLEPMLTVQPVTHTGHKNKRYECSECPYTAHNTGDVYRHERTIHAGGGGRQYQCDKCSASYDLIRHFEAHKQLHKKKLKPSTRVPVPHDQDEDDSDNDMSSMPRIVSVSSRSTLNSTKDKEPIRAVRSSRSSVSMAEYSESSTSEGEGDKDGNYKDFESNSRNVHNCDICEIELDTLHSLTRHKSCVNHIYNENIHNRLKGLPEGNIKPSIETMRFKKMMCKICKKIFPTWAKYHFHNEKTHGIVTKTKPRRTLTPNAPAARPRTAVVKSQPRFSDYAPTEINDGERTPESYYSRVRELQGKSPSPHKSWDKPLDSSVRKLEFQRNGYSCPEKNKMVTVTQQSKSGLKITTVKLGN